MTKNLVILGSGPAGLTAAIYAARAGLQPLVIHGTQPGGQLTTTTAVDNYPGFADGILGPELMDEMRKQAERFGTQFLNEQVESIDLSQRPFKLKVGAQEVEAQALIIACGATPRLLGLPAETKLMGRGVSVCATCDGFFFRDKTVFVVGGGDAALEEAITLTRWAKSVTVIHRRDTFRASQIMVDRAKSTEKLSFMYDSVVEDILDPASDSVRAIKVKNVKTGAIEELPADGVFIAIGHIPNTSLFKDSLTMNERGYLITVSTRTNIEGVFAAGDVQDERYRQAVVAAGDGCRAALEAQWYLERNHKLELKTVDNKPTPSTDAPADQGQSEQPEQQEKAEKEEHGPKHTVDVSRDDFEEKVLKSTLPVVVDFWAPWCGPCLAIAPRIEAIAKEYVGRVVVAKFNIDKEMDLWERFNIKGIPTLIVFKDGKEFKRLGGHEPYQFLKNEFDRLIAKPLPETEEIAAAKAELDAVMKEAMRKHSDLRGRAYGDVAKKHCPQEFELHSQTNDAMWAECDKLIPEIKAKHDAGDISDFDFWVARAEVMRNWQSDPANEQLTKDARSASEVLYKAMEPHMAEYEALIKQAEDDYNATVQAARDHFDKLVVELTRHTVDVTVADFEEEVLKSTLPVVVDFWSTDTGPCGRAVAPRIEAIAGEYAGRVVVAMFNIDNEPELWQRFNIKAVPTLIVYKDGKELTRLSGQEPYQYLKNEFDQLIAEPLPETEEIAAAKAELDAVMKAAMHKWSDTRANGFDNVAKAHCPEEWEQSSRINGAIWSESDKLIPEMKAKHDAGELSDLDYVVARADARGRLLSDPAHEQLGKDDATAWEALRKAMEPHMAEYEALVKQAEDEYNATVQAARDHFDKLVAELSATEPKKTFRRRVIFTSDNIEKVTIQDTVSVANAVEVVATSDLLFPSYVARFSQNRIIVATPTLNVLIEYVGPVEDMYEIYKVLKHRKRPEPKPVRSELENALDALH